MICALSSRFSRSSNNSLHIHDVRPFLTYFSGPATTAYTSMMCARSSLVFQVQQRQLTHPWCAPFLHLFSRSSNNSSSVPQTQVNQSRKLLIIQCKLIKSTNCIFITPSWRKDETFATVVQDRFMLRTGHLLSIYKNRFFSIFIFLLFFSV